MLTRFIALVLSALVFLPSGALASDAAAETDKTRPKYLETLSIPDALWAEWVKKFNDRLMKVGNRDASEFTHIYCVWAYEQDPDDTGLYNTYTFFALNHAVPNDKHPIKTNSGVFRFPYPGGTISWKGCLENSALHDAEAEYKTYGWIIGVEYMYYGFQNTVGVADLPRVGGWRLVSDTGFDDIKVDPGDDTGGGGISLGGIVDAILGIPGKIINGLTTVLKTLFEPDEALMQEITQTFLLKFAFLKDMKAFGDDLLSLGPQSAAPVIWADFSKGPDGYKAVGRQKVLDLSWYKTYKDDVDRITGGFLWLSFLWLAFKRAPDIINGTGMITEMASDISSGGKGSRGDKPAGKGVWDYI